MSTDIFEGRIRGAVGDLPDLSLFPKRLGETMANANITQSELGRRVGVDRSTVNRWLGGALPEITKIREVAAILHVSPRWLIGMSESDSPDVAAELHALRQRVAELTKENERLAAVERRIHDALRVDAPRRKR
jgi:transcriptional regulator with XRE-family HTH domain